MELKSFRELLLKKTEENSYLQTLLKYAKDDLIVDSVIESLLKMAEPSAAMGRGANSAITSYAGQMTNSDVEQLRDALGHHISHYKGALKTSQTAPDPTVKAKAREAADAHLEHIVPLMHLAGRASKHSNGKMVLDYRSTTPWESNYTTVDRHEHNGKLKEGTKDLGRRPKNIREGSSRGVPDYKYLEMAPHAGHGDTEHLPAKSGYPFEEIQLGSPTARDAGKAYLPIEDVKDVSEYRPHPFDKHPVHALADVAEHNLSPEKKEKFAEELANWRNTEHHKQWLADQKKKYTENPDAYKARGSVKPKPVFEDVDLAEQPGHARIKPQAPTQQESPVEAAEQVAPQQAQASAPKMLDTSVAPQGFEPKAWAALPEKLRQDIMSHMKGGGK